MKLEIFSPTDGEIQSIEKLNDGVFSEKMLGEGFYIKPDSNKFYSVFENSIIEEIFETKHAVFIKHIDGPIALMHIGLDTVTLKGEPFKYLIKLKDNITLKEEILEVDFNQIKKANLTTNTPVVFDQESIKGWKFKLLKTGKVKQGEVVATLEKEKEITEDEVVYKDKYEKIAEQLYYIVGGEQNFSKVYNCMTRLRFEIKNLKKVNEEQLRKTNSVKGFVWQGSELQIIFGGEVTKVREAFEKHLYNIYNEFGKNSTKNISTKIKVINAIKGMVLPAIPAFLAPALLFALKAILELTGVIQIVSPSANLKDYGAFELVLFNMCYGSLLFLTIFFTYNGVKYFGSNPVYGLLIGLVIASPILYRGVVMQTGPQSFMINQWSISLWTGKDGFVWMKIGPMPTSIFASIAAAITVVWIDKKAKRYIPTKLAMLLQPAAILIGTSLLMFFVFGPVISLIEAILARAVLQLVNLPFGLATMMYALTWSALVVTGAHSAVSLALVMPWIQGGMDPTKGISIPVLAGKFIAALGQMSAGIGIAIITKNAKTKQAVYGAIPTSIFGISEPMMFGVTLPNIKVFAMGIIASGLGGFTVGLMGGQFYMQGGNGVISILNTLGMNHDYRSMMASLMGWAVTIIVGIGLVVLFVSDRPDEKRNVIYTNRQIRRLYTKLNLKVSSQFNKLATQIEENYSKEQKKILKAFEYLFSKITKLEINYSELLDKEDTIKLDISKKIQKLRAKNQLEKIKPLKEKMDKNYFADKKENILNEKIKFEVQLKELEKQISQFNNKQIDLAKQITDLASKELNQKLIKEFDSKYYNFIYSIEIEFAVKQRKEFNLSRKDLKQIVQVNN